MLVFLIVFSLAAQNRPKIGLVLSGGGARGFAHIGILKMLDSLEIPVDFISGTSMGGITGALYAIGYSGLDLEEMSIRTDWQEIFTDQPPRNTMPYFQKRETGRYQIEFGFLGLKPATPSGLIYGQKVHLLFSGLTFPYERVQHFNDFPCPFRCVAVDLVTGNSVILNSGSLAKAMRSTMAIPTIFSPVEWGDSLLIDGGILNNLPVDVVMDMGADFVIGVDVGLPLMGKKRLNTALSVLEQSIAMLGRDRWKKNIHNVDILIKPDLTGFTMADFDNEKIRKIIHQGDLAARASLSELKKVKEAYQLRRLEDPVALPFANGKPQIFDLQITGHTTLDFNYVYTEIGLLPGDYFDPMDLRKRIAELKAEGVFEEIHYEVIPISQVFIRLLIRVKEKEKPVIHGLSIKGLEYFNFATVYRVLGIKPGAPLDTETLNKKIMKLYGLGYFEHVCYDIKPIQGNRVYLTITVKELPLRKLRIGLRYDNYHKLVMAASMLITSDIIKGLRIENEIQFAGLHQVSAKVYYPSRTLNLPAYPFFRFHHKNIPTLIFDNEGRRIAEYKDRSSVLGIGFGLLDANTFNLELEYQQEQMDIVPRIAFPDPLMFPSWKDRLRKFQATFILDLLDDVLLPRRGCLIRIQYEGSYKKFKSDVPFQKMDISADIYKSWHFRHTARFYGFWGYGTQGVPVYKFFNLGRPSMFIGMQYDQLYGSGMSVFRLDYLYELKKTLFIRFMSNMAFNYKYRMNEESYQTKKLWGFGAGIKFVFAPFGTAELSYGLGSQSIMKPNEIQTVGYFSLGTKF